MPDSRRTMAWVRAEPGMPTDTNTTRLGKVGTLSRGGNLYVVVTGVCHLRIKLGPINLMWYCKIYTHKSGKSPKFREWRLFLHIVFCFSAVFPQFCEKYTHKSGKVFESIPINLGQNPKRYPKKWHIPVCPHMEVTPPRAVAFVRRRWLFPGDWTPNIFGAGCSDSRLAFGPTRPFFGPWQNLDREFFTKFCFRPKSVSFSF